MVNIHKKYIYILLIIMLFITILNFPWVPSHKDDSKTAPSTKNVTSIGVEIPLNPYQMRMINYTEFRNLITNMSKNITIKYPNGMEVNKIVYYAIRNDSTNTNICFYIYLYNKDIIFDCTLFLDKKSNNTFLSANIYGSSFLSEKDIEDEKEVIKSNVEKIASAAHISIDWSEAEWSVSYAD